MNDKRNKQLKGFSQELRKDMTEEERHLWYVFLKHLPFTFNRQKIIGPYIVDFYCAEKRTVIELDGSQHFEEVGEKKDQVRDAYLNQKGIRVLRYSNVHVNQNFREVCLDILNHLDPEGSVYRLWEIAQDPPADWQEKGEL